MAALAHDMVTLTHNMAALAQRQAERADENSRSYQQSEGHLGHRQQGYGQQDYYIPY